MNTVVLFVATNRRGDAPEGGWRNSIYTRSLRKIGFIDNRFLKESVTLPQQNEYWLVEIVRENMTGGGCFILKPMRKVGDQVGTIAVPINKEEDLLPLVVGMYEIETLEGSVIITPHDTDRTKLWVMSPNAKKALLETSKAQSLVINHGGVLWPRRRPAEALVENEAKKLLGLTEGEPDGEA